MENKITRRVVLAGGAALLAASPAMAWPVHPNPVTSNALEMLWRTAATFIGQRVGDGDCYDFVETVYKRLGYPYNGYVWGRPSQLYHGSVLQMWNARWDAPDGSGYFETATQHTAIVATVQGAGVVNVIHQNWNNSNKVTADPLNFGWTMTRGRMEIFEPNVG